MKHQLWTNDINQFTPENTNEEELQQGEEHLWSLIEMYLDDFFENISSSLDDGQSMFVIYGKICKWSGRYICYRFDYSLKKAVSHCIEDYTEIFVENDELNIFASHHDGDNSFTIRKINDSEVDVYSVEEMFNERINENRDFDVEFLEKYTISLGKQISEIYGFKKEDENKLQNLKEALTKHIEDNFASGKIFENLQERYIECNNKLLKDDKKEIL